MNRVFAALPLFIACVLALRTNGAEPRHAKRPINAPGSQAFSPGIWIDWEEKAVEIDARVVLQRGPLELLACSPKTREHESILVVPGRPRDIYHALGLIGLSPGSPVRYDETTAKWLPPTGQHLHLDIRYTHDDKTHTVRAVDWLKSPKTGKPPERLVWVFAGSNTLENGRFGGDIDGTVVSVVDFESAVIAVGALHTADNHSLWLEANSDVVPPVGTKCRLIVTAMDREIGLELATDGRLRIGNSHLTPAEAAKCYLGRRSRGWTVSVHLSHPNDASKEGVTKAVAALVQAGIPREAIRIIELKAGRDANDAGVQ